MKCKFGCSMQISIRLIESEWKSNLRKYDFHSAEILWSIFYETIITWSYELRLSSTTCQTEENKMLDLTKTHNIGNDNLSLANIRLQNKFLDGFIFDDRTYDLFFQGMIMIWHSPLYCMYDYCVACVFLCHNLCVVSTLANWSHMVVPLLF